jgi:hypothetical protein
MCGNVLLKWTPAWLLLAVLLAVGVPTRARHRGWPVVESQVASPTPSAPVVAVRRPTVSRRPTSRDATAVLLMVLAEGVRRGDLSR